MKFETFCKIFTIFIFQRKIRKSLSFRNKNVHRRNQRFFQFFWRHFSTWKLWNKLCVMQCFDKLPYNPLCLSIKSHEIKRWLRFQCRFVPYKLVFFNIFLQTIIELPDAGIILKKSDIRIHWISRNRSHNSMQLFFRMAIDWILWYLNFQTCEGLTW